MKLDDGRDRPLSQHSNIVWVRVRPESRALPPLDVELSGWVVRHRRPSHWNVHGVFDGAEYHLKWFLHAESSRRTSPAEREYQSAERVNALDIPSVVPLGWGRHPHGTFFVMEGSPGVPIYDLPERPNPMALALLARDLGRFVARLHDAGLCHRDLYVDHVLIHDGSVRLIDVGRVREFRRRRWIVKDLGGLLYSAWREGIPSSSPRAFLASYLAASTRTWNRRQLLRSIQRKARGYRRRSLK